MQTNADSIYLDSSALVKLFVKETESSHLEGYLAGHPVRFSSSLTRVEIIRTARRYQPETAERARRLLDGLRLLRLDDDVLQRAATLSPMVLRTLDAIHLASAETVGSSVTDFVTYDQRLADAAHRLGFSVVAPGAAL